MVQGVPHRSDISWSIQLPPVHGEKHLLMDSPTCKLHMMQSGHVDYMTICPTEALLQMPQALLQSDAHATQFTNRSKGAQQQMHGENRGVVQQRQATAVHTVVHPTIMS